MKNDSWRSLVWKSFVLGVLSLFWLASVTKAADKVVIEGMRLQKYKTDGSMGVVKDTVFIRCFWPVCDAPVQPFAAGSSGIEVEGPPTPRNIVFPDDTIFRNGTRGDVFFKAETKVKSVTKDVVSTKENVDVGNGKIKTVTYTDTVTVSEPVREVTEVEKPKFKDLKENLVTEVKSK